MSPLLTHFLPGILVGWGLNYFLTLLTKRQAVEEVTHHPHDARPGRGRSPFPAWLRSRHVLGALVAFVVIVVIGSTLLVLQRQADQAACLRSVYDTTSKRLNDGGRIAKEDRLAVDDMVSGVIDPHKTPRERGQVLLDYLAKRKAREAARAKLLPYPLTAGCPD